MSSCGHGPEWQIAVRQRNQIRECLPPVPWCVPHRLPLGLCDACGSTVALGRWTKDLGQEDLVVALLSLTAHLGFYCGPEQDALIREAIGRLSA
jgi:hypothetical protein